jgi:hypothetical protein
MNEFMFNASHMALFGKIDNLRCGYILVCRLELLISVSIGKNETGTRPDFWNWNQS